MNEEQFIFLYTKASDFIQFSCEYILNSDFLINFPDWNNSWQYVNDFVFKSCENLGYISETCNL